MLPSWTSKMLSFQFSISSLLILTTCILLKKDILTWDTVWKTSVISKHCYLGTWYNPIHIRFALFHLKGRESNHSSNGKTHETWFAYSLGIGRIFLINFSTLQEWKHTEKYCFLTVKQYDRLQANFLCLYHLGFPLAGVQDLCWQVWSHRSSQIGLSWRLDMLKNLSIGRPILHKLNIMSPPSGWQRIYSLYILSKKTSNVPVMSQALGKSRSTFCLTWAYIIWEHSLRKRILN